MNTNRRRGITLIELVIVITVTAIIIIPVVYSMARIVSAERESIALAEAARELEPLTLAFQALVRESSTDTLAAPSNVGFVVRSVTNPNDTLDCYTTPNPYDTSSYTLLGTIWFDAANGQVRIQRVHPAVTPSWIAGRNVSACEFSLGPSEVTGGGGYANLTMDHGRSVMMTVTINTGRDYVHNVIAFSPNVR